MLKKKKIQLNVGVPVEPEAPTLSVRLMEANTAAVQAGHIFKVAAENLDRASDDLDAVAVEAEAEADKMLAVVEKANFLAESHRAQASAIRTAMGVN